MTTKIDLATSKANRNLLSQALGTQNQTVLRYFESMVQDITVTLPDAITNNGQLFSKAQTLGTVLTSGVTANAASISLMAGTWDISGVCVFNSTSSTIIEQITAGASTASGALGTPDTYQQIPLTLSGQAAFNLAVPLTRIVLANQATVYLVAQGIFTTSSLSVDGYISARPGIG